MDQGGWPRCGDAQARAEGKLALPVVFADCCLTAPGFPHSASEREPGPGHRGLPAPQLASRSLDHSTEPCLPPLSPPRST